jgi:hypothetical protein
MLRLLFFSGKLLPFTSGFGGRRCEGGCVGAAVEGVVGPICIRGDVGEEPVGSGFEGTRGLGGSERNVSATEGDGEGVRFATISGANRYWRTGSGDGEIFLST